MKGIVAVDMIETDSLCLQRKLGWLIIVMKNTLNLSICEVYQALDSSMCY